MSNRCHLNWFTSLIYFFKSLWLHISFLILLSFLLLLILKFKTCFLYFTCFQIIISIFLFNALLFSSSKTFCTFFELFIIFLI
jgi:hypothetical protein